MSSEWRHENDSYGGCVICREWVPGTDDETIVVPWPCPAERLRLAMTDEPGLRAALDTILTAFDKSHNVPMFLADTIRAVRASPATSDGSLDVERLARALQPGHDFVHDGGLDDCQFADDDAAIEAATRIAATYARLSESPSEGKTE